MPTVQFKDYYQLLGVDRAADVKAIRGAYRKLARKHHPDLNPGDRSAEERFKEVNEAYEVLSDAEKRKMYDRFGEDWQRYRDAGFTGNEPRGSASGSRSNFDPNDFGQWFTGQRASQPGASGDWTVYETGTNAEAGGFSDFFQTLFGARGQETGRRRSTSSARLSRRRGEDMEAPVEVSFDEAFHGATRTIQLQVPVPCSTCGGTGLVREGMCPTCDGTGLVSRTRTLEVTIPAGVATGSRVRIAGQGGPGDGGGPNGDVYLRVTVQPSPRFEREGNDLRTEIYVPLTTAVLGGEVVVPTPTSKVALTIPAETRAGRVFRLRGQGMPSLKGTPSKRGDLLARVNVDLPTNLSERERTLFQELRDIREGDQQ
jgi:DnaJ-class molecular chaperone